MVPRIHRAVPMPAPIRAGSAAPRCLRSGSSQKTSHISSASMRIDSGQRRTFQAEPSPTRSSSRGPDKRATALPTSRTEAARTAPRATRRRSHHGRVSSTSYIRLSPSVRATKTFDDGPEGEQDAEREDPGAGLARHLADEALEVVGGVARQERPELAGDPLEGPVAAEDPGQGEGRQERREEREEEVVGRARCLRRQAVGDRLADDGADDLPEAFHGRVHVRPRSMHDSCRPARRPAPAPSDRARSDPIR